jgi:hypothetical protein
MTFRQETDERTRLARSLLVSFSDLCRQKTFVRLRSISSIIAPHSLIIRITWASFAWLNCAVSGVSTNMKLNGHRRFESIILGKAFSSCSCSSYSSLVLSSNSNPFQSALVNKHDSTMREPSRNDLVCCRPRGARRF